MVQVSGDTLGIMTDRDLRPTAGGQRPTPFAFSLPSIHCAQWTLTHWRTLDSGHTGEHWTGGNTRGH